MRIPVDRFFFRLADFLSIAYLATVILTILLSPFSRLSQLELIKVSNLWLAPFQGLVTAALGGLFCFEEYAELNESLSFLIRQALLNDAE